MEANEASFAAEAAANEYRVFDRMVGEWVRLVDEDGTRDRDQAAHDKRDARLVQGFDGSWELTGRCGSLAGAELQSISNAAPTPNAGSTRWRRSSVPPPPTTPATVGRRS